MSGVDEEQPATGGNARDQLVKEKSLTMEYFLESRNLDNVTADMLRKYDKDGNGAFSKDEVVSIIVDLRQELADNNKLSATNKLFKRLLIVAVFLCVFLLAGMFALSYAVAALTAKTDVTSDGTLVAVGTTNAVATDSRAEIHVIPMNDVDVFCITNDELELMEMEVRTGRNVVVDMADGDGVETVTKISGGTVHVSNEGTCFTTSTGELECWIPNEICAGRSAGRRLSIEDRHSLGLPARRRLMDDGSCLSPCGVDPEVGTSLKGCYDEVAGEFTGTSCDCSSDFVCSNPINPTGHKCVDIGDATCPS